MRELPRKPLVEALFEVRWTLTEGSGTGIMIDKSYPLLVGSLYDQIAKSYPVQERLPAAEVPDELTPHIVKHRFRSSTDGWPVIQVGPGVATLNSTSEYVWTDFEQRTIVLMNNLHSVYRRHSNDQPLVVESMTLRYLNVIAPPAEDLLGFFSKKLHTTIQFPPDIQTHGPRQAGAMISHDLDLQGAVGTVSIALGTHNNEPAVILDLQVTSPSGSDKPGISEFPDWLKSAHEVIETWFFAFIAGELLEEYGGTVDDNHNADRAS